MGLRNDRAQVLPFGVILLVGFLIAAFGFGGWALALVARAQLRAAADAAATAATTQAEMWEALVVDYHEYACQRFSDAQGHVTIVCRDQPGGAVDLPRMYQPALFAGAGGALAGWAVAAGCQYQSDADAGQPLEPVAVCDSWHLQAGGRGLAWGFAFPPGSNPAGAAQSMLQTNTASMQAHGVHVQLLSLSTDDVLGHVDLTVRATEPSNPMNTLLGHPVSMTVTAGAHANAAPPAEEGS